MSANTCENNIRLLNNNIKTSVMSTRLSISELDETVNFISASKIEKEIPSISFNKELEIVQTASNTEYETAQSDSSSGYSSRPQNVNTYGVKRKICFDSDSDTTFPSIENPTSPVSKSNVSIQNPTLATLLQTQPPPAAPAAFVPAAVKDARNKLSNKLSELISKVEARTNSKSKEKTTKDITTTTMDNDVDNPSDDQESASSEGETMECDSSSDSSSDDEAQHLNLPRTISILRKKAFVRSEKESPKIGISLHKEVNGSKSKALSSDNKENLGISDQSNSSSNCESVHVSEVVNSQAITDYENGLNDNCNEQYNLHRDKPKNSVSVEKGNDLCNTVKNIECTETTKVDQNEFQNEGVANIQCKNMENCDQVEKKTFKHGEIHDIEVKKTKSTDLDKVKIVDRETEITESEMEIIYSEKEIVNHEGKGIASHEKLGIVDRNDFEKIKCNEPNTCTEETEPAEDDEVKLVALDETKTVDQTEPKGDVFIETESVALECKSDDHVSEKCVKESAQREEKNWNPLGMIKSHSITHGIPDNQPLRAESEVVESAACQTKQNILTSPSFPIIENTKSIIDNEIKASELDRLTKNVDIAQDDSTIKIVINKEPIGIHGKNEQAFVRPKDPAPQTSTSYELSTCKKTVIISVPEEADTTTSPPKSESKKGCRKKGASKSNRRIPGKRRQSEERDAVAMAEQHKALQQFEKPGPPEKKRRSAFEADELECYLLGDNPRALDNSLSPPVKKIQAPPDNDKSESFDIDGYTLQLFGSKQKLQEHVISARAERQASGKSVWDRYYSSGSGNIIGWRKRFWSEMIVPITAAPSIRHRWLGARKLLHGLDPQALVKLGLELPRPNVAEAHAPSDVTISIADAKFDHMKIKSHQLAPAKILATSDLEGAFDTLGLCFGQMNKGVPGFYNKKLNPHGYPPGFIHPRHVDIKMEIKEEELGEISETAWEMTGATEDSQESQDSQPDAKFNNSFELEDCTSRTSDVLYDYDDTREPNHRPLPEVLDPEINTCGKDTCRLGCVCASLARSNHRAIVLKKHCGEAACIFGCRCKEWRRRVGGNKAIWDGTIVDDDGRFLDDDGKLRSSRASRPSQAALAAIETQEYFDTIFKKPKLKSSRSSTPTNITNEPTDDVVIKKEADDNAVQLVEFPDGMDARGTFRKQPMSASERRTSMEKVNAKKRSHKASADEAEHLKSIYEMDLESRLTLIKNPKKPKSFEAIDKKGKRQTCIVHTISKRVDRVNVSSKGKEKQDDASGGKNLDIGRLLDDDDEVNSCARTTVYVPVWMRQHNTNTAPRYTSKVNPEPQDQSKLEENKRKKEPIKIDDDVTIIKEDIRPKRPSLTIDVDDKEVIDVESIPSPTVHHELYKKLKNEKKFVVQMVLLQRKMVAKGVANIPHLLEIHSNCKWDKIRSQLLSRISVIADRGKYPTPSIMIIGHFQAAILPRGNKPTRIPEHLRSILKFNFVYSIRIRITQAETKPKILQLPSSVVPKTEENVCDVQIVKEEKNKIPNNLGDGDDGHTDESKFGMSALNAMKVNVPGMRKLEEGGLAMKTDLTNTSAPPDLKGEPKVHAALNKGKAAPQAFATKSGGVSLLPNKKLIKIGNAPVSMNGNINNLSPTNVTGKTDPKTGKPVCILPVTSGTKIVPIPLSVVQSQAIVSGAAITKPLSLIAGAKSPLGTLPKGFKTILLKPLSSSAVSSPTQGIKLDALKHLKPPVMIPISSGMSVNQSSTASNSPAQIQSNGKPDLYQHLKPSMLNASSSATTSSQFVAASGLIGTTQAPLGTLSNANTKRLILSSAGITSKGTAPVILSTSCQAKPTPLRFQIRNVQSVLRPNFGQPIVPPRFLGTAPTRLTSLRLPNGQNVMVLPINSTRFITQGPQPNPVSSALTDKGEGKSTKSNTKSEMHMGTSVTNSNTELTKTTNASLSVSVDSKDKSVTDLNRFQNIAPRPVAHIESGDLSKMKDPQEKVKPKKKRTRKKKQNPQMAEKTAAMTSTGENGNFIHKHVQKPCLRNLLSNTDSGANGVTSGTGKLDLAGLSAEMKNVTRDSQQNSTFDEEEDDDDEDDDDIDDTSQSEDINLESDGTKCPHNDIEDFRKAVNRLNESPFLELNEAFKISTLPDSLKPKECIPSGYKEVTTGGELTVVLLHALERIYEYKLGSVHLIKSKADNRKWLNGLELRHRVEPLTVNNVFLVLKILELYMNAETIYQKMDALYHLYMKTDTCHSKLLNTARMYAFKLNFLARFLDSNKIQINCPVMFPQIFPHCTDKLARVEKRSQGKPQGMHADGTSLYEKKDFGMLKSADVKCQVSQNRCTGEDPWRESDAEKKIRVDVDEDIESKEQRYEDIRRKCDALLKQNENILKQNDSVTIPKKRSAEDECGQQRRAKYGKLDSLMHSMNAEEKDHLTHSKVENTEMRNQGIDSEIHSRKSSMDDGQDIESLNVVSAGKPYSHKLTHADRSENFTGSSTMKTEEVDDHIDSLSVTSEREHNEACSKENVENEEDIIVLENFSHDNDSQDAAKNDIEEDICQDIKSVVPVEPERPSRDSSPELILQLAGEHSDNNDRENSAKEKANVWGNNANASSERGNLFENFAAETTGHCEGLKKDKESMVEKNTAGKECHGDNEDSSTQEWSSLSLSELSTKQADPEWDRGATSRFQGKEIESIKPKVQQCHKKEEVQVKIPLQSMDFPASKKQATATLSKRNVDCGQSTESLPIVKAMIVPSQAKENKPRSEIEAALLPSKGVKYRPPGKSVLKPKKVEKVDETGPSDECVPSSGQNATSLTEEPGTSTNSIDDFESILVKNEDNVDPDNSTFTKKGKFPGFYIADNPSIWMDKKKSNFKSNKDKIRDIILNHPDPVRAAEFLNRSKEQEVDVDDDAIEVTKETAAARLRNEKGPSKSSARIRKKRKQGIVTRDVEEDTEFVEEFLCLESKNDPEAIKKRLPKKTVKELEKKESIRHSLALHCVRERQRRLELANNITELANICCPDEVLMYSRDGKLRTCKGEIISYAILTIQRLLKEYNDLKEEEQQEIALQDTLTLKLKKLKSRLRNQFAGMTRDETTGATIVCEEPD